MKNSSRIEETIPQNLTRSRSGSPVGSELEHAPNQVEL